jgi:hypothetical protein
MYFEAVSIPQAVRQVIGSNTLFFHSLKNGIANYTALAHKIKADVELLTKTSVNINTLVVAIKRFADSLKDSQPVPNSSTFEDVRMSLTGSILDIDFNPISSELLEVLDDLTALRSAYNIFRTNEQIRLFTEDANEIRSRIQSAKISQAQIKQGLSKITITNSSAAQDLHNFFLILTSILYDNQIQLYNAFYSENEIILILNVNDAARAYESIRRLIDRNRQQQK